MLFGFSVFMNNELTPEEIQAIGEMAKQGFGGIFTSMHIPEDDATSYRQRLATLGEVAKKNQLSLMVDISGEALSKAGFSYQRLQELTDLGVTGLRMDYAIDNQTIAQLSHKLTISLNASTLTEEDIAELMAYQADFSNLEAWHNYYPRPETGLAKEWFQAKNQWLKQKGFLVQAFVAGDAAKRGPLYQGLPTLEAHRQISPFAAALELVNECMVDAVYIGDGLVSTASLKQFATYLATQSILLRVQDIGSAYYQYVLGEHMNRQDEARDVVRSANARFREIPLISPEALPKATQERVIGSVTVDNQAYLRYMGEIQICKNKLPTDDKVNVVAKVIPEDLPLISQIKAGMGFIIERDEKNDKN
jgi:hypothetical protein